MYFIQMYKIYICIHPRNRVANSYVFIADGRKKDLTFPVMKVMSSSSTTPLPTNYFFYVTSSFNLTLLYMTMHIIRC